MFDGLLASSNMAYFDRDIRASLSAIYAGVEMLKWGPPNVKLGDIIFRDAMVNKKTINSVLKDTNDVIEQVTKFYNRHRYNGRWRRVLVSIYLEYDD